MRKRAPVSGGKLVDDRTWIFTRRHHARDVETPRVRPRSDAESGPASRAGAPGKRANVPHRCDVSSHIEEYFGHLTGEAGLIVLEVLALKRAGNRERAKRVRALAS